MGHAPHRQVICPARPAPGAIASGSRVPGTAGGLMWIASQSPVSYTAAGSPNLGGRMSIELESIPSETADARSSVSLYKIVSYPADFTLRVLYEKWRDEELIVPKFQRKFVWTASQASRLIESFLMGLPVPEIFLYNEPSQKQIIIDGHQRLKSVFSFFDGVLPDGRPFYLRDVNQRWQGKTYEELEEADRRRIRDSVLRSIFVEQLDPRDVTSIYVRERTALTFRNPKSDNVSRLLNEFSAGYSNQFSRRLNNKARVALNSIIDNKNWLAHGESSKLQVTVKDVDGYFRRSARVFEVLEDILK